MKRFVISVVALCVALFLLPSYSYAQGSEVTFTTDEVNRLKEIIAELKEINNQQETRLQNSELQISLLEETIKEQRNLLQKQRVYWIASDIGCLAVGFGSGCIYGAIK